MANSIIEAQDLYNEITEFNWFTIWNFSGQQSVYLPYNGNSYKYWDEKLRVDLALTKIDSELKAINIIQTTEHKKEVRLYQLELHK